MQIVVEKSTAHSYFSHSCAFLLQLLAPPSPSPARGTGSNRKRGESVAEVQVYETAQFYFAGAYNPKGLVELQNYLKYFSLLPSACNKGSYLK